MPTKSKTGATQGLYGRVEPEFRRTIRLNLKAARLLAGVAQHEVADRYGIKQQIVSSMESKRGRYIPSVAALHAYASFYGVEAWTLMIPKYYYRNIDTSVLEKMRSGEADEKFVQAIRDSANSSRKLYTSIQSRHG